MAEKGKVWSERETRAVLEVWSEGEIQRQLQGAVRNDIVYSRIVAELAKRGYKRTVTQCRAKIKALKMRYKQMVDRLRRSGAGRESDEESDESSEFPYFALLDSVLGGRAGVTPVNLLDSADRPGTPSGAVPGEPTISRPETPAPIPGEPSVSRPNTPAAVLEPPVSMPDTPAAAPGESSVGRPDTPTAIPETPTTVERRLEATSTAQPQPSTSHDSPTTLGTPSKKKRRRITKLHRAEASAKTVIKEVMDSQEKAKRRREDLEERRLQLDAKREERENERDRQFMATMSNMMMMMSQYMGTAFYPPMPMPSSFGPQPPTAMPPSYGPPQPSYQPPPRPPQPSQVSESEDES